MLLSLTFLYVLLSWLVLGCSLDILWHELCVQFAYNRITYLRGQKTKKKQMGGLKRDFFQEIYVTFR